MQVDHYTYAILSMLLSVCMELHVHCNNLFTVPLSNQNQVWYWLESGQPIWGEAPTATNSFYPEMHFFFFFKIQD